MAEKKVSKKEATNQKTGRLKKGYKAKGKGVYVKVTATAKRKPTKKKATKRRRKPKAGIAAKITRAVTKILG